MADQIIQPELISSSNIDYREQSLVFISNDYGNQGVLTTFRPPNHFPRGVGLARFWPNFGHGGCKNLPMVPNIIENANIAIFEQLYLTRRHYHNRRIHLMIIPPLFTTLLYDNTDLDQTIETI